MGRPLALPLFAVIAGELAAFFTPVTVGIPLLCLLLFCAFLALLGRRHRLSYVLLLLLLAAWGNRALSGRLYPAFPPGHLVSCCGERPVTVEGTVAGRPERTATGIRYPVEAEWVVRDGRCVPTAGRLLLTVASGEMGAFTGDRIRFRARLRRPVSYGIPGENDYARHLALRDIFVVAHVENPGEMVLVASGVSHPVQRRIDLVARRFGTFIERTVPAPESGVLRALLIGERGGVPQELEKGYALSGVNHILSISGFHVGVLALFTVQLLLTLCRRSERLLLYTNARRLVLVGTLPVVFGYLLVSGGAPATLRSVVMFAVVLGALWWEREHDPIDALILAALAILAVSPADLLDISFQLSFLALWGILVVAPPLARRFRARLSGTPEKIALFFAVSLTATLATAIPVAFYFQRVTLAGLVANFLIVPLLGYGAVVLGFSAFPLVFLAPPLARFLLVAAGWLVSAADRVVGFTARIPPVPPFATTRLDVALSVAILVALTFMAKRRWRVYGTLLLAAALLLHLRLTATADDGKLVLTFLSVGQGESTLVRLPNGATMLIDGGGRMTPSGPDVGERLVVPALRALGVRAIDYLVLSHPHPDHCQGLAAVVAAFPVGEFWEPPTVCDLPDYRTLKEALAARRVPTRVMSARAGPVSIGGVTVTPLLPASPTASATTDLNDGSLVLRLGFGRFTALMTGDIGAAAEAELVRGRVPLAATLLKVAHHGSAYSSSLPFLEAVQPRIAVISAGRGNPFHLPAPGTLGRLSAVGADVCRTDRDGTVQVRIDRDGGRVSVLTWHNGFHLQNSI